MLSVADVDLSENKKEMALAHNDRDLESIT